MEMEQVDQRAMVASAAITVRIPRAVEMLGIGRSKLYQFIQSGEIETIKVGRATLIPVDSLHEFVSRRRRD